jgi:hypothetical protein
MPTTQKTKDAQPAPKPSMSLTGLLDAWERSDALGRRELLAALFIDLDVREGRIWRIHPQSDIAAELWTHLKAWRHAPSSSEIGVLEVAPAGFEPAISALRGLRPRPLDDGATFWWAALGSNQ